MGVTYGCGLCMQILNGSNLVISNASAEDTGSFRCWVANTGGQVVEDVSVTVLGIQVYQ